MRYVGHDRTKIYKIFIIGSLIPLAVYICWQAVALGIIPLKGLQSFETIHQSDNALGMFVNILSSQSSSAFFELLTEFFTFFAISTSFLGVGISLFDFYGEIFGKTLGKFRISLSVITFLPSLIIALYVPEAFIFALEFAALALAVLAVLLPCIVLYRMKRKGIIKSNVIVTHTWVMLALYVFGLAVTTIVINNLIYN
jgi:tyrosine-specific transport protein